MVGVYLFWLLWLGIFLLFFFVGFGGFDGVVDGFFDGFPWVLSWVSMASMGLLVSIHLVEARGIGVAMLILGVRSYLRALKLSEAKDLKNGALKSFKKSTHHAKGFVPTFSANLQATQKDEKEITWCPKPKTHTMTSKKYLQTSGDLPS